MSIEPVWVRVKMRRLTPLGETHPALVERPSQAVEEARQDRLAMALWWDRRVRWVPAVVRTTTAAQEAAAGGKPAVLDRAEAVAAELGELAPRVDRKSVV